MKSYTKRNTIWRLESGFEGMIESVLVVIEVLEDGRTSLGQCLSQNFAASGSSMEISVEKALRPAAKIDWLVLALLSTLGDLGTHEYGLEHRHWDIEDRVWRMSELRRVRA
jgi:hypothetical protein